MESLIEGRWLSYKSAQSVQLTAPVVFMDWLFSPPSVSSTPVIEKLKLEYIAEKKRKKNVLLILIWT